MPQEPLKPQPAKPTLGKPTLRPLDQPAVLRPSTASDTIPLAGDSKKPAGTIPLKPLDPRHPAGVPLALKEPRLVSLDAFRGFVMLMMASSGFALAKVVDRLRAAGTPEDSGEFKIVSTLAHQFEHVVWQGGVFWDLIQPAFMFMVGAALPFSYARRAARGDSYFSRLFHTIVRSLVLIAIGVFLANPIGAKQPTTEWTFANVLCQIGLGYTFVFLFVNKGRAVQAAAIVLILAGSWYAFYQHPLPPEGVDYKTVGVSDAEREQVVLPGMKGHWSKNTNFAADVDRDWLNRLPRTKPPQRREGESDADYAARVESNREKHAFRFNPGGYATLNFVPSIATMLLGLMIGELLRRLDRSSGDKLIAMLAIGALCLGAGLALHYGGVCPIVKRIWTPSWALASGGVVIWMLALFYLVIDHWGWRRLAWPLAIVGMNSLVVYLMSQLLKGWTRDALYTHLSIPYAKIADWLSQATGKSYNTALFGGAAHPYQPLFETLAVLGVFWLVCWWLWRQKLFVRI